MKLSLDHRALFEKEEILCSGVLDFSLCRIIRQKRLDMMGFSSVSPASSIVFLVPYYVHDKAERNISAYAVSCDYHLYFQDLFSKLCDQLQKMHPQYRFCGAADNSPLDERHAAALCGLGILGDNGLLIHPLYGSYVFIGEILSDMPHTLLSDGNDDPTPEIRTCEHCGACQSACPIQKNPYGIRRCLSEVTQQKRLDILTDPETNAPYDPRQCENYIRHYKTAWGCDLCQSVCPHNRNPKETPIPFFHKERIPYLTSDIINGMSEDAFSARAYAWRKRPCILRNLSLLEKDE